MRTQGPNKLNTALFDLRSEHYLSQEKLSDLLGVTRNLVWSIETGKSYGKIPFWVELQKKFNIPDEDMWKLIMNKR